MRGSLLKVEGVQPIRNPDGSPVLLPHPETGHAIPIFTYEAVVLFNGEVCECVFADEEAGVVLVHHPPAGKGWVPPEARGFKALTGKVEIRINPLGGPCSCWECGLAAGDYTPAPVLVEAA